MFENRDKKVHKEKRVDKKEKLLQQKAEAAQRYATPPPSFCLGVKK